MRNVVQAREAAAAAESMRDAAASIRKQVDTESAMLDTHASLARELAAAEAIVKVRQSRLRIMLWCWGHLQSRFPHQRSQ